MKNRTEMHEGLIELTRRCRIFAYLCDNSNQPKFWADSNAPQFVLAHPSDPSFENPDLRVWLSAEEVSFSLRRHEVAA